MAAFTEVTNGFAPQLNMAEIVNAVNERRLAAIASGVTGLPDAIPTASPQSFQGGAVKPTHLLIQEMLEALAIWYVDHGATTPVDTPYTLTTFRTRAGLNSSGFRRASTWANPAAAPSFSYGKIQTGDIAGYWIWEDIVKGLEALKWTRKGVTSFEGTQLRSGYGEGANAVADADASWMAASWTTADNEYFRNCLMYFTGPQWTPKANIWVWRSKHKVLLSAAAPVNVSAEFWSYISTPAADRFFDLESYSENTWILFETVAIAASGTNAVMKDYNMVANPMSNPMSTAGIGPDYDRAGSACGANWVMLKWTFSHS